MKTRKTTLILGPRETISVAGGSSITVLAGTVWMTDRGRDIILSTGGFYCSSDSHSTIAASNPGPHPATIHILPPDAPGCSM